MEVRIIKTCEGLKEIRILNGAVVSPDVAEAELRWHVAWQAWEGWAKVDLYPTVRIVPVHME